MSAATMDRKILTGPFAIKSPPQGGFVRFNFAELYYSSRANREPSERGLRKKDWGIQKYGLPGLKKKPMAASRPSRWPGFRGSGLSFELTETVARPRVVGADLERRSEFLGRPFTGTLCEENRPEVRVRFGVVRIDRRQSIEGPRRVGHPTRTSEVHAEVVERVLVMGIEAERQLILHDGFSASTRTIQDEPEVVPSARVIVSVKGSPQHGIGLRQTAQARQTPSDIGEREEVSGDQPPVTLEQLKRFVVSAQRSQYGRELIKSVGIFRIEPESTADQVLAPWRIRREVGHRGLLKEKRRAPRFPDQRFNRGIEVGIVSRQAVGRSDGTTGILAAVQLGICRAKES